LDWGRAWAGRTFLALRHRNYRLMWTGTMISNTGDWMDQVALNWLVISTTGSPFDLALMNLCRGLPILLFTLVGGAMADRLERRRLMMMTQTSAMLLAFVLAALVLTGSAPMWAILVVATLRGIIVAFNLPARHSMVPELVPPADVPNALALNSTTVNLTKVIGPALAGIIVAFWGSGICFLLNGLSFLVVLWTLHAMEFPPTTEQRRPEPLARSIIEGLAYVRSDRTILLLLLVALVPQFFGQPYQTLLALFAYDVFHIGPEGLGFLVAASALGSVLGGLALAGLPRVASTGRWMLIFLITFGTLLCTFALNPVVRLAPFILLGVGATQIAYNASNNTILQMRLPNHMRGRVTSILLLNRGLVQLGAAASAFAAGFIGAQWAVASTGLVIILFGLAMLIRSTRILSIRPAPVTPAPPLPVDEP
jgi:MFS family permease